MIAILQSLVLAGAGILVDSVAAPWNALDDAVLRARAAVAFTNAAVSVTEKRMVPEGGDRHDYMSFGPYWWPDPSKKDGLPFIRRDGEVNPTSLVDSDRVRLERMCSDVAVLAAACRRLGNRAAGAEAARKLRRFFLDPETAMRPHLNYGQAIPGRCKGRGIGIIETRLLAETLVDAILILREQKALSAADDQGLVKWFADYLDWLVSSPIGKDEAGQLNNHGTAYDLQVAVFALFTGHRQHARETLARVPSVRIDVQIEPDGRQPRELARTCSLGYSTMNAALFCELASVADGVGVDLWGYVSKDGRSIRRAVEFLLPYWRKEKPWPYKQIKNFRFDPDAYRVPLAIYNHMIEGKVK